MKLSMGIIEARPLSVEEINILELSDKGDSPLEATGSNRTLEEKVWYLTNTIQKPQAKKWAKEEKSVKLNNLLSKKESQIQELNKLVDSMQRKVENRKVKLQVDEDGHISLNENLNEVKTKVPSKYHLFTARLTI